MRRRYIVTGILVTDKRVDGTTTEQAKELLELAVDVGLAEADLEIDSFEVKTIGEDANFAG